MIQPSTSSSLCHTYPRHQLSRKAPSHGSVSHRGRDSATNNRLGGYNCHNIWLQGQNLLISKDARMSWEPKLASVSKVFANPNAWILEYSSFSSPFEMFAPDKFVAVPASWDNAANPTKEMTRTSGWRVLRYRSRDTLRHNPRRLEALYKQDAVLWAPSVLLR